MSLLQIFHAPEIDPRFDLSHDVSYEGSCQELSYLVLPHRRKLKGEKMYLKRESLERIERIKGMLREGYRIWQIREYLESGRLLFLSTEKGPI